MFSFKSSAKYRAGRHYKEKTVESVSLTNQQLKVDIEGRYFQAAYHDVFSSYQNPPLNGNVAMANEAWSNWKSTPFDCWCTTARSGVSFEDHMQADHSLLVSVYLFHVYYTKGQILEELRATLPGDKLHSWYENPFDDRPYKRLSSEFGVPPNTLWWQKVDHPCKCLGSWSTYMTPLHVYRHAQHIAEGPFFHEKDAIRHNRDIIGRIYRPQLGNKRDRAGRQCQTQRLPGERCLTSQDCPQGTPAKCFACYGKRSYSEKHDRNHNGARHVSARPRGRPGSGSA